MKHLYKVILASALSFAGLQVSAQEPPEFESDPRSQIELSPEQIRNELGLAEVEESDDTTKARVDSTFYNNAILKIDVYKDPQNLGIKKQFLVAHANGDVQHVAIVSTGTRGHETGSGYFSVNRRERYWVSSIYGSRMDFAVFFNGGIALHQSPYLRALGARASHGCVRQSGADAEITFGLIGAYGARNVAIRVNSGAALPAGINKRDIERGIAESQSRINAALARSSR